MSDIAVRVEALSKKYTIGAAQQRHDTLRDLLVDSARGLLRRKPRTDETTLWALRDVSFDIQRGEVVGVIGRNGAGKSTLLKILSRITEPTSGRALINGRVGSLLEVGTGFHPELTGRENIYLNGAILGMRRKEIERKFDEIVAFAEIERFLDTPVKRYSSGMYVRLAFAVAAHLEPEILLVDEVLAVGDAAFQKKCLGKMGDVAKEGRTVLFVSHNMAAVSGLCASVITLIDGQVSFNGDTTLGIRHYIDNFNKTEILPIPAQIRNLQPDTTFTLLNFLVIQRNTQSVLFVSNEPVVIELEYEIKQAVYGLRIGFDFKVADTSQIIFRCFHDDAKVDKELSIPGKYRTRIIIPANLLAQSKYEIDLSVGIHNVRWIIHEQVSFQFEVKNIKGINSIYADSRPGVIMPLFEWKTISIE